MPERDDIDPAAIRRILADSFVLAVEPGQHPRFRVAGTRICELFGRECAGRPTAQDCNFHLGSAG